MLPKDRSRHVPTMLFLGFGFCKDTPRCVSADMLRLQKSHTIHMLKSGSTYASLGQVATCPYNVVSGIWLLYRHAAACLCRYIYFTTRIINFQSRNLYIVNCTLYIYFPHY
ncbi:MAG: hypothetical protein FMNOHCHN_01954 [Ignavibacteriaceae bacterium]|nr:hypothetical protein [Ignavibacteriaceae bacterium]